MKTKITKIFTFIVGVIIISSTFSSVTARPLVQIEVGDEWTYEVSYPSGGNGINKLLIENVTYTVDGYDYDGNGDDQIRINKIAETKVLDVPIMKYVEGEVIYLRNSFIHYTGGIEVTFTLGKEIRNVIYRTARGNLPYKRETTLPVNLTLINIDWNGTLLPPVSHVIKTTIVERANNPTIIETVSTGVVKLNNFIVEVHFQVDNLLGIEGTPADIFMAIHLTQRYESSNTFTYKETTCRNVSITPLSYQVAYLEICSTNDSLPFIFTMDDETNIQTTIDIEDWVYSYDAGLPLEVVKYPVSLSTTRNGIKKALDRESDSLTMKLIKLDVMNANFTFPTEETTKTSIPISIITSSLALLMVVAVYRRKAKK